MFSKYIQEMYPEEKKNDYPEKLCNHLVDNYMGINLDKSINFLDIGCGRGTHIKMFMKRFKGNFFGVDLESSKIENAKVFSCNLEKDKLPFQDNYFDVIFTKSAIEHVTNTHNFINEVYRTLKPGGTLVIMTPDWQSQMKNFFDDPTHVKPFTIKSLYSTLRIAGFENVEVDYFIQLPVVWKFPILKYACSLIDIVFPEKAKWTSLTKRNSQDRKFIRFAKEKMLIGVCTK